MSPDPQPLAEGSLWQWGMGGWLWLLAIFSWMVFLVVLKHRYSPVHRISTTLQSGLIGISATLLIVGVLVGMNRFGMPEVLNGDPQFEALYIAEMVVEQLALAAMSAGLLMGGGVTTWVCIDLVLLRKLPTSWMVPGAVAGLLSVLTPLLTPELRHLLIALVAYCVWCLVLGLRGSLPEPYPELE
ncbi:MAG: hypothetical protein OXK78_18665 [Caldilineaceae bacterium]|nr:hypothetical protein [Caldilineaceae bacterium]